MYKLLNNRFNNTPEFVIKNGVFIPFDPANTDYQAFLRWCEEGNTPLPADEENT